MKNFLKRQVGKVFGFAAEIERLEQALVGVSVAVHSNTRFSSAKHRMPLSSPFIHQAVIDAHTAVDREMTLREALAEAESKYSFSVSTRNNLREALSRKTIEFDELKEQVDGHIDAAFRASEAHVVTMTNFQTALDRITDMVKGDDGQAFKEAEKFLNRFRSTKTCIKCDSTMIPMHDEDKKLCSNGACGHELDWKLEEGQQYQYKRNVEPFIEDRSKQPVAIDE